jgi:hypothetical protein
MMMDNMLYTYVATYLLSRLAIMAAVGYMVYAILRPQFQLSRLKQ